MQMPQNDRHAALEEALLSAHANSDASRLVQLYQRAAGSAETEDAEGFFLTQAYVFALQTGHPDTGAIKARLVAKQREY